MMNVRNFLIVILSLTEVLPLLQSNLLMQKTPDQIGLKNCCTTYYEIYAFGPWFNS
jgi:hypothetical protein